ncbi:MAG: hypothetical protein NTX50_20505, partial [Candidatus Sumerlaeota bacterium]|nr:hypothetical protein [Candidatus Sumerlaeota bacterium]
VSPVPEKPTPKPATAFVTSAAAVSAAGAAVRTAVPLVAATSATQAVASPFAPLIGQWVRSGEEYVLMLNRVNADGTADAAYYNPNPIHVSVAKASQESGEIKLFVELRDTGYPGCTYKLTYRKASDTLNGVYYQAAMQQSYDIFFERVK